jgi:hypothetical protein
MDATEERKRRKSTDYARQFEAVRLPEDPGIQTVPSRKKNGQDVQMMPDSARLLDYQKIQKSKQLC